MAGAAVQIKAKELLKDLRTGLYDEALMRKYGISATQLQRLLQKLVDGGFIEQSELNARAEYLARKKAEAECELFISLEPDSDEDGDSKQANPRNSEPHLVPQNEKLTGDDLFERYWSPTVPDTPTAPAIEWMPSCAVNWHCWITTAHMFNPDWLSIRLAELVLQRPLRSLPYCAEG